MATTVDPSASQANPAAAAPSLTGSPSSAPLIHRRTPEDAIDYVTVSDPVIHADGMNKYTSYRVDCRPPLNTNNDPAPPGPQDVFLQNNPGQYSSVLRRYSDFLWLYDRLHKEKAGGIIPPLPEKQAVSRFSPEFVEDRRRALEKFVRRVILHPELWEANCLMTFLRADDVTFQHAKNASKSEDASNNSNHGGDMSASMGGAGAFNLAPKNAAGIKKWFSEAKTTFSGDLVSSPDDDLFDEIERYIEALFIQMKRVSNQSSGLVRKSKEIANGLFEFGLAFHQLGQSEGEELGAKLQLMGGTADTLSAMAARQAEAELQRLEEPFKDYIKTIHAVKLALNRRHDKRVSYTALLHQIQTREINLHRLRMTPGSEAKAYSTEMSLQRYRAAANVAQEEYAECSQRVLREVDRFKREKAEEMKLVVLEFIRLEIEVNRGMERVWGELVPKLEEGGVVGAEHQQQQVPQPAVMNMPPSQMPPPVPSSAMPPSSQPMYSNVPVPVMPDVDPMMESSIQYRDNNLPGMGL
eukprot:CAMPEP_0172298356 /NCGR_PEP_ID=MMETSP1058-20130122/1053_1 /TAXON_ID=83371 /ORGANISM="Detonula confervacea, Strain CCMP 353" /LENGTH=523 /DNA_ID=CAMNT_0013007625 /DNA_START=124 /DNA_END=1695 /DNA_ORIENTATION=-